MSAVRSYAPGFIFTTALPPAVCAAAVAAIRYLEIGHALERDTGEAVKAAGGKVLGAVRAPLNTPDFSSFLLQAQASKAKVIGLANAGGDTINSIKQASEFGIPASGQKLAGLLVFLTDVHSLGLKTAQGLTITSAWYWDKDDASRAFAKRFMPRNPTGMPPTYTQAGVYTEVAQYLKAIQAAGTDDADKVVAELRKMKINDFMTKDGWLREDGRVMRDMYLEEVKSPAESKYPFDYFKILATIPADQAFRGTTTRDGCGNQGDHRPHWCRDWQDHA